MMQILNTFLHSFFHPYKTLEFAGQTMEVLEKKGWGVIRRPQLAEFLVAAWLMNIIKAIVMCVIILFGSVLLDAIFTNEAFVAKVFEISNSSQSFPWFFWLALSTLFFPITEGIRLAVWKWFLEFYVHFSNRVATDEESRQQAVHMVLTVPIASHTLVFLPFIGDLIQRLSEFVLSYISLREVYGFGRFSTFFVIGLPSLLFFLTFGSIFMCLIWFFLGN